MTQRADRFEALWQAHYDAILAFLLRRVPADRAPDLAEETFLAAWRRLDERAPEPRLWLLGIARGLVANERRARARSAALMERIAGSITGGTSDHLADAGSGATWAAFASLRPAEREAIALIAWDELTPSEAAKVLGCSDVAFRVRLHRARRKLEAQLARPSAVADSPVQGEVS